MTAAQRRSLHPRALQLSAQGLGVSAVAERLSVPKGTVHRWLSDAGLLPQHPPRNRKGFRAAVTHVRGAP